MTKVPRISSAFAILDVKAGRRALARYLEKHPDASIPVTLHGHIVGQHSRDDGVSIEFSMTVEGLLCPDEGFN